VDDPTQRCPDITLARSALGWEPRTALRQGLALAIEWFASLEDQRNGAPVSAALGN
jgi:nucleoside-diphosphate-sugar epimerase